MMMLGVIVFAVIFYGVSFLIGIWIAEFIDEGRSSANRVIKDIVVGLYEEPPFTGFWAFLKRQWNK